MQVIGHDKTTYILLSGITVPSSIALSENIELLPADTSHLDFSTALLTCSRPDDISVVAAFIPRITAQFKISAENSKDVAALAWNSSWDALLLSAIFHTEIGFNLQSDTEASAISSESHLHAINYHMQGFTQQSPHPLTVNEVSWISLHFDSARRLLDGEQFQTAIHCLASYRWHSVPRIKMAVLWAGIEGLFGASSEIRFRISLYIARFLYRDDDANRKVTFEQVKKLYNSRSSAVHGSKIKGNIDQAVQESAEILRKLLVQCIVDKSLPNENELVP